jgi:hypothetical protein
VQSGKNKGGAVYIQTVREAEVQFPREAFSTGGLRLFW